MHRAREVKGMDLCCRFTWSVQMTIMSWMRYQKRATTGCFLRKCLPDELWIICGATFLRLSLTNQTFLLYPPLKGELHSKEVKYMNNTVTIMLLLPKREPEGKFQAKLISCYKKWPCTIFLFGFIGDFFWNIYYDRNLIIML